MKIANVLVIALSAGTLLAQAPTEELDARIQVYGEMIRPASFTVAQGVKDRADSSTGVGARFMGELASARNFYYELGGKLDSSSNLTLKDPALGDLTDVKITSSYWTVGIGYLAPLAKNVSLGFHLEGRGEALAAQGATFDKDGVENGRVDVGTTYLRPWFRVSLDGTFQVGTLRPYVGVEAAATPVKTSQTLLVPVSGMDDRTLRSMAPTVSGAFYVGLRF